MLTEFEKKIIEKQNFATNQFSQIYNPTERECKTDLLDEVLYQIEICEGLCRPLTDNQILDWLKSRNLGHLAVKVRTHKFCKAA